MNEPGTDGCTVPQQSSGCGGNKALLSDPLAAEADRLDAMLELAGKLEDPESLAELDTVSEEDGANDDRW